MFGDIDEWHSAELLERLESTNFTKDASALACLRRHCGYILVCAERCAMAEVSNEHSLSASAAAKDPHRTLIGKNADPLKKWRHNEFVEQVVWQIICARIEECISYDLHRVSLAIKQRAPFI